MTVINSIIPCDQLEVLPTVHLDKDGFLAGFATVTRTGVFPYVGFGGALRGELRHPDEIFKKESIDTLEMIPITLDHPPELLNVDNASKYQVGTTGQVFEISDNKIIVSIKITNKKAIEAILSGKVELSLGYRCDLKQEEGEYKGQHYEARQCNIVYNHLAIVVSGRAGHTVRFRFDSAENLLTNNQPKGELMEDDKQANSKDDEIAKLKEEVAALKAKLEDKKESNVKMDAMIEKKALARADLMSKASPFLEDQNFSGKSDREIMETTIKSFNNDSMDFSNCSDDYIKGIFDNSVQTGRWQHMDARGMVHKVNMSMRTNNDSLDNVDALEQWLAASNDKQINSRKGN